MLGSYLEVDLKGAGRNGGAITPCAVGGDGCVPRERILWHTGFSTLKCSTYETYPSFSMENERFSILLEGSIYNIDKIGLPSHLECLAEAVFGPDANPGNDPKEWLLQSDGDFLVVMLNKQNGEVVVLNDLFGRLPTFYSVNDNLLVVSRDIRAAAGRRGISRFDATALAQYLLLGMPLGKRTWYDGVHRLEPATLIRACPERSSIDVVRVHEFNFDGEEHASKSPGENARNLADLFRDACCRRSRSGMENIVSLSGGLDSRAVAAGLWGAEVPFTAASFLDAKHANGADFETAQTIAATLGAEWSGFPLPLPRGADVAELLAFKGGLNTLRMSFILRFFQGIGARFGPSVTYFTGDGGGDVLGDSTPYRKTKTLDSLTDYLLERYQVFSPEDVTALTGVPVSDLRAEVFKHLAAYPEQNPERKYRHFFCVEVPANEYNEGEDRNRRYFWSATPFYAPEVFLYAMNCPDGMKKGYRLFRDFLAELHPAVGEIRYANWNAPVQSPRFKLLYAIKNMTRTQPELIRKLRRITGRFDTLGRDSNVLRCMAEQSRKAEGFLDCLNPRAVQGIVEKASCYDTVQLWTLFTLTSLIDGHTGSETVLSRFSDREFS